MKTPLEIEVQERFGVLPNFFRLAPNTPEITRNLWEFARFAYLDNPLPSLFKERLFVYLSRFCDVRYCIARHVGFLVGLGHPSGDDQCPIQTVEDIVRLVRRPLPRADELKPYVTQCAASEEPLSELPEPESAMEQAIFACATHAFLQTPDAPRCLDALKRVFGESRFHHVMVFLGFVRTAHYWTKVHAELTLEEDIQGFLSAHSTLAECLLNDPEAETCEISQKIMDELTVLRANQKRHEELSRAHRALSESEERYRVLFGSVPMAVFVCDHNAVIQQYNRRAVELWGREPMCGVEKHCGSLKLYRPDGTLLPHAHSPMLDVLRTGIPVFNVEVFIERPDRSRIAVIVNFAPLKNAEGDIIGAITSFEDVTERRKAQEEVQRLNEALAKQVKDYEHVMRELQASKTHLQEKIEDLENFHDLVVGRELKMMQLEKELKQLKEGA